jgi:hypothetical protein
MKTALALLGALFLLANGVARADSLEEQTRHSPGSSSLHDDSDTMRGASPQQPTNSLDNGSIELRSRAPAGSDSLDNGAMDGSDDNDDSD